MSRSLYWVKAPYFTAGVLVDKRCGYVVAAAPILSWAVDKHIMYLIDYWQQRKGFEVRRVP